MDELLLLVVVAGGDGMMLASTSSELDEKIVENILNSSNSGKAATIPIKRINAMIYEEDAILKAR